LVLTDEQALILVRWYAVDEHGRFLFRRGCSRRSKGWGKSPIEAAKAIGELAGPVVFDGWDSSGEPVGRPWGSGDLPAPWVQVAAVSEDQTDNTWSVLHHLLTANDGSAADELGIDAGLTRCFLRDRQGKAEPVTAAAGSREGQPVTYGVLDETHLWTPSNGGVRLAATIRRNAAKMGGRSYETTNSFAPGEGTVAEATHKAVQAGRGIFYDALEAPTMIDDVEVTEESPDAVLESALRVAYGGAWWVDTARLVQEIRDPDTKWEDACRFFLNWNRKGEGRAVDPKRWAELARPGEQPPAGARVALGFDGSISDDSTVLIGCCGGRSFLVRAWERPRDSMGRPDKLWRVPRSEVDDAVREAFARWDVGRMFCDPPRWSTEIEAWGDEFAVDGDTVEERERVLVFDTNQHAKFARAVDRWLTAIKEGTHTHDASEVVTGHVLAAHKKKVRVNADEDDGRTMYVLVKGYDGRKIDAAVADVLAFEAEATMPPIPVRHPMAAAWA
jgi:hypothetical protein